MWYAHSFSRYPGKHHQFCSPCPGSESGCTQNIRFWKCSSEGMVHPPTEGPTERGIIIVNITQCQRGVVEMGRYETGLKLLQAGVISGYDSTPECAVTKLMFLLGHGLNQAEIRYRMNSDLAGEITK